MSYIKKYNFAVEDLAMRITPLIEEQIQETIAWQTDGYEFADHIKGDDYIQFANEIRVKILEELIKNK